MNFKKIYNESSLLNEHTEAMEKGYLAYEDDKEAENPYEFGTDEYIDWEAGYGMAVCDYSFPD